MNTRLKEILVMAATSAVVACLITLVVGGLVDKSALGSGTRFPNGISADSTAPSAGQVRGTTLTITGAATLSGGATLSGANTLSGATAVTAALTVTSSFIPDSIGGGIYQVPVTTTSTTFTAAQICSYSVIDFLSTTQAASGTLPTAVNLQADCLSNTGGSREILFRNLGTATTTFGFNTSGSSSTLQIASTSSATALNMIQGGGSALLRFTSLTSDTTSSTMVQIDMIQVLP